MVDDFYGTAVKFFICTITTVNSNVNYGLWVINVCQQIFTYFNECITLVRQIDSGRSCMGIVDRGYNIALFYLLLNFAVNLKLL